METQEWTRKEYDTWDEAFRGLSPVVRQQSVRVAAYTRELFVQACADSFGKKTSDGAARIRGKYADLAYKCGMYHQLGKALVPHEYQVLREDFTEEEKAVYWKYTTDGRSLVTTLQEKGARARGKRGESARENITWQMLRESCEEHMERWDGTGLPNGKKEQEISAIAQIVGLARELDRLSAEVKSENPFDEALAGLIQRSGTDWSPELIEVLQHCEAQCRQVYEKYILYTKALPATIPLVEKRENRPMGLSYRPMVSDTAGTVVCYEAVPWFGGIIERPGETESAPEVSELLKRTELLPDVCNYLMYEASDTALRMINCKLALKGVLLQLPPAFYYEADQLERMDEVFVNQEIPKESVMLLVPEETLLDENETAAKTVALYLRHGYRLVLDNYHPENIKPDQLKAMGLTQVRFAPELYMSQATANIMNTMRRDGFTVIGGNADSSESLSWQLSSGAVFAGGTVTGEMVTEDELIRDCLLKERKL